MKTKAVLAKIEEATREMAEAEGDLDRVLREIQVAPRAQKTTISEVVQKAFAELRTARSKLVELQDELRADENGD